MRFSPVLAEIVPSVSPTWHIVRCHAGQEGVAIGHLVGRRFGVYVPLEDFWKADKGEQKVERQALLFPGYVFLFLWGLAQHYQRVRACPGVAGFLTQQNGLPVYVDDKIIKQIQDIEFAHWVDNLPRSFFRRRKRRGEQFQIERWQSPNHGFADPDPEARISELHKALGITGSV